MKCAAYDEHPAQRIRDIVGTDPGIDEKKIFGDLPSSLMATWP
jgi:hypothetical protein